MFGFLIGVEVLVSILLIIVILMQSSKGGGLAGTFGGGSVGMVFGVRRTADFLTKATQILAGTFLLLSLLINIAFLPRSGNTGTESVIQGQGTTQQGTGVPQSPPAQPPVGPPGSGN